MLRHKLHITKSAVHVGRDDSIVGDVCNVPDGDLVVYEDDDDRWV